MSLVPLQVSVVHTLPSSVQAVPVGLFASAGQATLEPSQVSVRSQTPAELRHTVPDGTTMSAGQSSFTPSQLSSTSQMPAEGRQTAVLFPSSGQSGLMPSQNSATSHT